MKWFRDRIDKTKKWIHDLFNRKTCITCGQKYVDDIEYSGYREDEDICIDCRLDQMFGGSYVS